MTATLSRHDSPLGDPGASDRSARERALNPTLILVALVVAVMSSVGAPLIPSISAASHVSLGTGEWLLTIALLTGALATPIMGRLADGPHPRRVIAVCLSVVLIGSVLAAVTSTFALLVLARALQGMGLGILPVTMAVARRHLPMERASRTIAVLSVTAGVGVGLGYPITGVLAEFFSYHAAFWFSAGVVAAALTLSLLVLPGASDVAKHPFDTIGAGLLTIGVAAFILAVSEGESWGWGSAGVLVPLLGSFLVLGAWARYELGRHEPLVDLRHARNRLVLTADISGLVISVTMYLFLPIVVEFVQLPTSTGFGFGASIVVSGCVLIPLSVGTMLASRIGVMYERRFGRRTMIPVGSVLFALSMAVFAFEHTALWEAFLVMGLAGLGIGFTFAAMPGFIVQSVAARDTGSALGFYQVLRSIGLALGSAISGLLLAAYTRPGSEFPTVGGFRTALILGALLCLATGAMAYVLPGRKGSQQPTERELLLGEETAEVSGSGLPLEWESE